MTRPALALLAALPALLAGCATTDSEAETAEAVRAEPETLGSDVGERIDGDIELRTESGQPVRFAEVFADGPVVVTFYRGGWCPFCEKALAEWQDHLDDLQAQGARFVAITPERPDLAASTSTKHDLGYTVLSDSSGAAARAFGVEFTLDEKTQERYAGYNIDLASRNAAGTWTLPHPGTFVVDEQGVVRWAHVDADYRRGRADPDEVVAYLASR